MASRTVTVPDELDERIKACTRAELPNLSKLISKLLERELTRIEARRKTEKSDA